MSLALYPLLPAWLLLPLLALAVGALLFALRRRNPAVSPQRHALLLALRAASLLLLFLMLLCPGRMTEDRNLDTSHIVLLADRSASMATRDLAGGRSRWEAATDFLRVHRFKRLADYPTDVFTFNGQTLRHTNALALADLRPEGGTDLRQALSRIDKDLGLSRAAAVVLLSDGLDLSGFKGSEIAAPLLSVQVGTDLAEAKDLGIEPFACPSTLNAGEELTLEVPVLMRGYPEERRAALSVSVDGKPLHTASLALAAGRVRTETVKASFDACGAHILRVECDSLPDEVTTLNNRRELIVEVVQAKEAVAAYFPVLNNSFRPLLREFSKSEDTAFTAVYRVAGESFRLRGQKPDERFVNGLPKSPDALKNLTCLILGAHNGDLLTPAESLVLERYVDRGGTLICLAGTDSFGKLPSGSPLSRLLPVATLEESFSDAPFRVVPDDSTSDAFVDHVRQILADNAGSPDLTLKGLNRIKDLKAGAKVLLWADGASRSPLLVWQRYGRGKVVALLSNALHLWGPAERRDENFGRFWRQLVAFSKSADDDADLLKAALSKTEAAAGEPVTATAVASHPEGRDGELAVKVDVFPAGGDAPVESLALVKAAGGFSGELAGLKPGRYVVRFTSRDARDLLRTRHKLLLVGDVIAENASVRSDREAFRAFSGEKQILGLGDADRLEELLSEAVRKNIVQRERFLIFESPLFLAAALLLLLTEWFLRRRFNLF